MIGFLLRRWRNRRRRIFRFWDGKGTRSIDPLQVIVAIEEHPEFNAGRHPREIASGNTEAIKIAVRAVREIFHISPVENGGLTMDETLDVYCDFWDWWDALKKKDSPLPTPPPPTDATSSGSTEETTDSSCNSTPMSNDPRSDNPTELEQAWTPPPASTLETGNTPSPGFSPSTTHEKKELPSGSATEEPSGEPASR